ncbi:hypothetical protein CYQ88_06160 [Hydrogenovibrio sp. SC-1]|uniref:hypothetical protein n=1 Tax=Hydrogenovibrio sp. SC-1 TaxID=2065820 RepID=UPI000C7D8A69|nr:hypothetical protein [Hydrogenovibrio sp. SC-1]PLA74463.1 hypothetical protein CYQ88_06160 [Hydrogenovibrio sp. SC-1]
MKNSHIIPEFIYSSLYDEKHRFHEISDDVKKKNKMSQKGIREKLLCSECEQHLSKYERYASLVLNGGFSLSVRNEGRLVHLGNIDYQQFKLFALSVLWRAGVSNLSVFSQVKLGPHEEKLRVMVLNDNPGTEYQYPFILSPIIHENKVQEALIVAPTWTRLENHYAYRFVFGGIAWVFVVSGHKAPKFIIDASINREDELTMIPWELSNLRFITDMAQELAQQDKL